MKASTALSVAAAATLAAAFAVTLIPAKQPPGPTFDQRWGAAMEDIYRSQDELRRTGHIRAGDGQICTKRWCDPHPKGDRR